MKNVKQTPKYTNVESHAIRRVAATYLDIPESQENDFPEDSIDNLNKAFDWLHKFNEEENQGSDCLAMAVRHIFNLMTIESWEKEEELETEEEVDEPAHKILSSLHDEKEYEINNDGAVPLSESIDDEKFVDEFAIDEDRKTTELKKPTTCCGHCRH